MTLPMAMRECKHECFTSAFFIRERVVLRSDMAGNQLLGIWDQSVMKQVELHPYFVQQDAIENMKAYGVIPQAWGPLAEGKHGIFTDPELTAIGDKYGKTAAQVALRWNAQRGVSIIPKSVHVERMEQNLDIWDFTLTDEEMATVASKDIGHSEIVDHSDPSFVKFIYNYH